MARITVHNHFATRDKLSFDEWMEAVDRAVQAKAGLSVYDLDDYRFRDAYDAGRSPASVASSALKNSGWGRDRALDSSSTSIKKNGDVHHNGQYIGTVFKNPGSRYYSVRTPDGKELMGYGVTMMEAASHLVNRARMSTSPGSRTTHEGDRAYDEGKKCPRCRGTGAIAVGREVIRCPKCQGVGSTADLRTDRGHVAEVVAPQSGRVVARSPLFIRREDAERWLNAAREKALRAGVRVIGRMASGMHDPEALPAY